MIVVPQYIVGFVTSFEHKSWEFAGVFSTEEKAVKHCYHENCFVARINLDEFSGEETSQFEYCYYPKLEERPA